MNNKFFSMPFKTFTPENLLQEMLNAKEGEVFILGEKNVAEQIGEQRSEITFVQIKKAIDPPRVDYPPLTPNEETYSNCCGAGDLYDGNLDNNEGVCADCGEHCEMEEQ